MIVFAVFHPQIRIQSAGNDGRQMKQGKIHGKLTFQERNDSVLKNRSQVPVLPGVTAPNFPITRADFTAVSAAGHCKDLQ